MKINPILRYGTALGCLAYGFAVSSLLPDFHLPPDTVFYGGLAAQLLGVFAAMFACLVKNEVVFKIGWLWWSMRDLCRHVGIIGDTGCGKTLGVQNFIFRQYIKNIANGAAVIIGTKGDEPAYALSVAKYFKRASDFRLLQVRPDDAPADWEPPSYYNFVSDRSLPWSAHAKAIVDTASALTEGQQSSFFKPSAMKAIAYGLRVLEVLGQPINLTQLYDLLTSRSQLAASISEFKDVTAKAEVRDPDDLRIYDFFFSEFISPKGADQSAGQEATVAVYLWPFLTPAIREVFCSKKPNTFTLDQLDEGMILATSIPQRFFSERQFVHTYLKTLCYYHALRRLDKSTAKKSSFRPIGIFGDEFQDLVTASEDGMADHKIVDRVRSANFFIVAAMQSELSPDPKIGDAKRKVLTKNLRTRFYFRQADEEDAKSASSFLGTRTVRRRYRGGGSLYDMSGGSSIEEIPKVRTDKLINLPDFVCYAVHPQPQLFGQRYTRVKMRPIDADGSVPRWFRFGAFSNLLKNAS